MEQKLFIEIWIQSKIFRKYYLKGDGFRLYQGKLHSPNLNANMSLIYL